MNNESLPEIPSSWRSRKHGTRHVVDCTLGGDIVYTPRRYAHYSNRVHSVVTLDEWKEYEATAKRIDL